MATSLTTAPGQRHQHHPHRLTSSLSHAPARQSKQGCSALHGPELAECEGHLHHLTDALAVATNDGSASQAALKARVCRYFSRSGNSTISFYCSKLMSNIFIGLMCCYSCSMCFAACVVDLVIYSNHGRGGYYSSTMNWTMKC